MTKQASIVWKVALALLLGAAVVFAAPVMGASGPTVVETLPSHGSGIA
jgi:hypothetical protein